MCGIAGILNPPSTLFAERVWDAASKRLHYRGPDASKSGLYDIAGTQCLLGHRRLRIVDLSALADQPMSKADVHVVYNGEIYNFVELRQTLTKLGYEFHTTSDTEVLINAYRCWGVDCFARFDGMWAVAIIDENSGQLILSRDHFGEKPLYYLLDDGKFYFASTADALNALTDDSLTLNPQFFAGFIRDGYCPANNVVWRGVSRLEPGEVLLLDIASMQIDSRTSRTYLGYIDQPRETTFDIDVFEGLVLTALERRLMSDAKNGLLLSGGIDSSYIAALIKQELNHDLPCITIEYGFGSHVETDRAREVTKQLGLEHRIHTVQAQDLALVYKNSIASMDEPISDAAYPMLVELLSHIEDDLRVLLTGDGADELFLSYDNYRNYLKKRGALPFGSDLAKTGARLLSTAPALVKKLWRGGTNRMCQLTPADRLMIDVFLRGSDWKLDGLTPAKALQVDDLTALYMHAYQNDLAQYLLTKSDRASMCHSIELRSPFLSLEVQDYVFSCTEESLKRGSKSHIVNRLETRLGSNFSFEKRGFFASGEVALNAALGGIVPGATAAKQLECPSKQAFSKTDQGQYRLHVLSDWLDRHAS